MLVLSCQVPSNSAPPRLELELSPWRQTAMQSAQVCLHHSLATPLYLPVWQAVMAGMASVQSMRIYELGLHTYMLTVLSITNQTHVALQTVVASRAARASRTQAGMALRQWRWRLGGALQVRAAASHPACCSCLWLCSGHSLQAWVLGCFLARTHSPSAVLRLSLSDIITNHRSWWQCAIQLLTCPSGANG